MKLRTMQRGDWPAVAVLIHLSTKASVSHPGSAMIARTEAAAAAVLARELNARRGETMVWLVPVDRAALVRACYDLGARNCELHVAQVRGAWQPPDGVNLPTFMPETC